MNIRLNSFAIIVSFSDLHFYKTPHEIDSGDSTYGEQVNIKELVLLLEIY